jgi:hypothetical protein
VNQIADRWGVDTESDSCVWFEIDRKDAESAA